MSRDEKKKIIVAVVKVLRQCGVCWRRSFATWTRAIETLSSYVSFFIFFLSPRPLTRLHCRCPDNMTLKLQRVLKKNLYVHIYFRYSSQMHIYFFCPSIFLYLNFYFYFSFTSSLSLTYSSTTPLSWFPYFYFFYFHYI